jgi:hypothetical protein
MRKLKRGQGPQGLWSNSRRRRRKKKKKKFLL